MGVLFVVNLILLFCIKQRLLWIQKFNVGFFCKIVVYNIHSFILRMSFYSRRHIFRIYLFFVRHYHYNKVFALRFKIVANNPSAFGITLQFAFVRQIRSAKIIQTIVIRVKQPLLFAEYNKILLDIMIYI